MSFAPSFFLAVFLLFGFSPVARASETCDDEGKVYGFCQDQNKIFDEAMNKARKEKKKLLVVFGAEWCPWCISLHRILSTPELRAEVAPGTALIEIALYREREKLATGMSVLDKVAEFSKRAANKKSGMPVLAVLDPDKRQAVFIDTAPLEKNTKASKGHDSKKLATAIKKATATL